jgi:hypothetical protein
MKIALLFMFAALPALAQTNSTVPTNAPETFQTQTNQGLSQMQRFEKARMDCVQARRIICGKIVKILPDGLVIDSGYMDLVGSTHGDSWLIPGSVTAGRPVNLVEANRPDSVCIGLVFITDLPKGRGVQPKPKLYDYVNLEGFPVGQYTYTSVGDLQRTVREFTTKLYNATLWNFAQSERQNAPPK